MQLHYNHVWVVYYRDNDGEVLNDLSFTEFDDAIHYINKQRLVNPELDYGLNELEVQ